MIRPGLIVLLLTAMTATPSRVDRATTRATTRAHPAPNRAVAPSSAAYGPASGPAVASLRADVERYISSTGWRGPLWSVTVISLDRGDTLVALQPDLQLAPASNMKLFTTAAALYYLGPHYRYSTFLLADGPIENGVLNGDLIIYGTGDPTISDRFGMKMSVWNAFADTLAALGVREVRGNIVADATYFSGTGYAPGWQHDYINASYAAPASALTFAENIATLNIKPGAAAGDPAIVQLIPGGDGIAIENTATTVARGRTFVHVSRATYDGPVIVRGQIRRGAVGVIRTVPLGDPPRYAAAVLRETLQKHNITVTGQVSAVMSPDQSPVTGRMVFAPAFSDQPPVKILAIHQSPPLQEILEVVNKKSHNLLAEQTLRTVGRVALGEGTAEAGARAVAHLLDAEASGSASAVAQMDGSGLSVLNRVSTRSIIHLLSFMAKSPMFNDYYLTLPEAGARDGLHRMYRTPAEGNLRAKTGTIDNVSSLAGYVRAANGERLAFSIISNNVPTTWRAKRVEDAIGARLASFDRAAEEAAAAMPTDSAAVPAATPVAPPVMAPAPKATATPKTATGRSYTIKKGDTLSEIAQANHTTVAKLQRANPGLSPRRLVPGRKIKIPG